MAERITALFVRHVKRVGKYADGGNLYLQVRRSTRKLGLSFGDRACLALAHLSDATALTADRSWSRLELDIAIEVIR